MLSEAWRLSEALAKAKINVERQHPLIKPLPASLKHFLRVRLDEQGNVATVEEIADDERAGLRRIVQTSDGSFPMAKVNQPMLSIRAKSPVWRILRGLTRTQHDSRKQRLLERCFRAYPPRGWNEVGHNWSQSREKATLLLEILENDPAANGIVEVSRRFQSALNEPRTLTCGVVAMALASLRQGRLSCLNTVQELLVGKGKDSRERDRNISVMLVFDLDQSANQRVYEKKVWSTVAGILPLNLSTSERQHMHRSDGCAFGKNGPLLMGPFPQVKLPILGTYFPLVSMASDGDKAKCNRRYGLTEYATIPVSEEAALRMQDALTWIVQDEREGETWHGVANGQFDKDPRTGRKRGEQDLLIAFVDDKPEVDAKTSKYIGPGRDVTEGQFEVDARAIADAFNADPQITPKSKLHFFLLHKASDGQAQVALAEAPTVEQVLSAAERWVHAARANAPHVRLWLPQETRSGALLQATEGKPLPPYPEQVVQLLSYQWVRDGSSPRPNHEIVGPRLGDVLHLMLRTEGKWEPAANRMLELLIQRLTPLLIGVFGAQHAYGPRDAQGRRDEPLSDYPRASRESALRAVSVTAILLDALECRKEEYVNNAPFQVGQVLALADTLHKDYCTVVRKGQLPNTLIGTALMRRALDNPAAAIADLGERMMEYVRWAKTADTPRGNERDQDRIAVNEARKKLRQYQPLAATLGTAALPIELDDVAKAQLLLGFLASPPDEVREQNGKDDK